MVVTSIEEISREHFGSADLAEARPRGGFAASPAFDLTGDVSRLLRIAYETTMPELYFGGSPLPTWEAIRGRVSELRELL